MGIGNVFEGLSRRRYSYALCDDNNLALLPKQAGNYIFARADLTPVHISCAHNLRDAIVKSNFWAIAQSVHGANRLYIHVDPHLDERARNLEMMDLIDAYDPPMNARG